MGFVTLGIDDVEVVVGARVVVGVGVLDTDDLSVEREICETEEPMKLWKLMLGFHFQLKEQMNEQLCLVMQEVKGCRSIIGSSSHGCICRSSSDGRSSFVTGNNRKNWR